MSQPGNADLESPRTARDWMSAYVAARAENKALRQCCGALAIVAGASSAMWIMLAIAIITRAC